MKWPLVVTWFLLRHTWILGAPRAGCEFPAKWRGRWFLSGVQGLVAINGSIFTTKGRCIEAEGDKFLIQDVEENCNRCIVMHEKHHNVLQYKETYCGNEGNLESACKQLAGDAILFSLFRSGAAPSPCPIKGPMEFTYSRDEGECKNPLSQAEACTQDSRLLLRYQACADLMSSERFDVELECLATWKEGSTQYLVARLHGKREANDEDRYRCFVYSKPSDQTWNLAQSGDATCSGLVSATEGARVLRMQQKQTTTRCSYPSWLVSAQSWVALDSMASTRLLASDYNLTLTGRNETRFVCHSNTFNDDPHLSGSQRENRVKIVAKATKLCDNGYVCLVFHRRDDHVMELQQSRWSQQPEEACRSSMFDSNYVPYTTFITEEPKTRQCPYLGRYKVVSVSHPHDYMEGVLGNEGKPEPEEIVEPQEVRVTPTPVSKLCLRENVHRLDIGCKTPDRMKFTISCSDDALSEYHCHGTWVENDTAYLVASTDAGRYCIVYSASTSSGSSRELTVTGHLASCPRASHRHQHSWQVNLTSHVQCGDVSSASSQILQTFSPNLLVIVFLSFGSYVLR